ncbi:FeoC-like transcriptional regulator [Thiomicrorhabdus aquaedulcis]|uniref:FeoC-like transcriptional regulator n=1 Tax=Thiomicrorhabdus aquaedulcis TaxID=2211106 RepID=UPI000FD8F70C|nr:FeoC-like transcriptional regulator [Thiomicrorhabdus aquaedulcis]
MILLSLKNYIQHNKRVSLLDICRHFDLTQEAALGLVQPLLTQGFVQAVSADVCASGACQSGCGSSKSTPSYQWVNRRLKNLSIPVQIL